MPRITTPGYIRIRLHWFLAMLVIVLVGSWAGHEWFEVRAESSQATQLKLLSKVAPDELICLALGDWGHPNRTQLAVAQSMSQVTAVSPVDLVLLLGDNFYYDGVQSPDDPQFENTFEVPFRKPGLQIPFYAVLGNHDYHGNPQAQVEYSDRSSRWIMPSRYYTFERTMGSKGSVLFVGIDTELLMDDPAERERQLQWLREELLASTARWKVVFGHRPIRSPKDHNDSNRLAALLDPIFEETGVDLCISGHRHELAMMQCNRSTVQVISGSASDPRYEAADHPTYFQSTAPGFVHLRFNPTAIHVSFVDSGNQVLYHRTVEKVPGLPELNRDQPNAIYLAGHQQNALPVH